MERFLEWCVDATFGERPLTTCLVILIVLLVVVSQVGFDKDAFMMGLIARSR